MSQYFFSTLFKLFYFLFILLCGLDLNKYIKYPIMERRRKQIIFDDIWFSSYPKTFTAFMSIIRETVLCQFPPVIAIQTWKVLQECYTQMSSMLQLCNKIDCCCWLVFTRRKLWMMIKHVNMLDTEVNLFPCGAAARRGPGPPHSWDF